MPIRSNERNPIPRSKIQMHIPKHRTARAGMSERNIIQMHQSTWEPER